MRNYYDKIAKDYDGSRFDNSYGAFIHAQETNVLGQYLDNNSTNQNLDLACGTGRFLPYAAFGADISGEMLQIAGQKYPDVHLVQSDAAQLPFEDQAFKNVLCFHLFMHLDMETFDSILKEVYRVTKSGGLFIFDVPSEKRRAFTKYTAATWHGGNQTTSAEIIQLSQGSWDFVGFHGISFLPLHRVPVWLRRPVRSVDTLLCNSPVKEYASHLIFVLRKI
ncbi:MAG: class I SAM-dependent methyltransferase [Phaeodactylibacter sp.]|nr:class I SAM-dependent methyltransferase [Phaeodactylibacter sp.]